MFTTREQCVQFGMYEFNPRVHELRKCGLRIRLGGHAARILGCLLEKPGEIRSRGDLRLKLWPGNVYVDFEQSLNKAIHELRLALNDSATTPHFIETVPGEGYRFIATLSPALPSSHKKPSQRIESLAVLPLTAQGTPEACEWLAAQLTVLLTNALAKLAMTRVLAHGTVKHCQGGTEAPQQRGERLGVSNVLTGELAHSGAEIVCSIELINVADGAQVWGDVFRIPAHNGVSQEEKLVEAMLERLRPVLIKANTVAFPARAPRLGPPQIIGDVGPKIRLGPLVS